MRKKTPNPQEAVWRSAVVSGKRRIALPIFVIKL